MHLIAIWWIFNPINKDSSLTWSAVRQSLVYFLMQVTNSDQVLGKRTLNTFLRNRLTSKVFWLTCRHGPRPQVPRGRRTWGPPAGGPRAWCRCWGSPSCSPVCPPDSAPGLGVNYESHWWCRAVLIESIERGHVTCHCLHPAPLSTCSVALAPALDYVRNISKVHSLNQFLQSPN